MAWSLHVNTTISIVSTQLLINAKVSMTALHRVEWTMNKCCVNRRTRRVPRRVSSVGSTCDAGFRLRKDRRRRKTLKFHDLYIRRLTVLPWKHLSHNVAPNLVAQSPDQPKYFLLKSQTILRAFHSMRRSCDLDDCRCSEKTQNG